jgi:hypothetical protein
MILYGDNMNKLVIFYSHANGNTKHIAEMIAERAGVDLSYYEKLIKTGTLVWDHEQIREYKRRTENAKTGYVMGWCRSDWNGDCQTHRFWKEDYCRG